MPPKNRTDYRLQHLREKLGDLYEFQAFLGRGAFAAVYLVRNLRLNRPEALKVLSEAHDHEENFVRRFIQEAKLVASLDHPNIVKVYDYGEIDGIVWFSMQYVDGPTLRAELTAQGRLSQIAVARLAIPLLGALDYSHSRGIVHRDIKPSNILLDSRGHPYIMDFGIAKSSDDVLKTMTGKILGTPAYISPEQIQGLVVDGRADVYSLSVAMYEMLAGQTPFQAEDSLHVIVKRLNEDPDPLSKHCFSLDETLEAIVMRGLERELTDRYPDADSMRRDLVVFLSGQPGQQGMSVMATAPTPQAIEDLPSTVPEAAALEISPAAPTVKMSRRNTGVEPGGEATLATKILTQPRGRLRVATTLAGIVVLAFLGWWGLQERPAASPAVTAGRTSPGSSAATPSTATEDAPQIRQSPQVASASESAPITNEPREIPPEPEMAEAENQKTASETTETRNEPIPTTVEPAAAPPPTENRTQLAIAPPPPPPPLLVRRPVTAPKILSSAEPVLPSDQSAECVGQSVILSLRIGEEGQVQRSKVLKAGPETCTLAAQKAAEAYRFEPALDSAGQPVPASTTLNIRFP